MGLGILCSFNGLYLTFSMGKISYQMCYINGGVSRGFEIELANSTSSHNGLSLARREFK